MRPSSRAGEEICTVFVTIKPIVFKTIIRKFSSRQRNCRNVCAFHASDSCMHPRANIVASVIFALLCCAAFEPANAADTLHIDLRRRTVTADVSGWSLDRTLTHIAARTGWVVYTEPGIDLPRPVSERFRDVPLGRALGRLLSGINFALRPRQTGPETLLIFRTAAGKATVALPDKSSRIKNQLVVMLKPGSTETIEEIAANLGAKVVGRIKGLNAYRLEFPYDNAMFLGRDALLRNDNVAGVDFNYRATPPPGVSSFDAATRALSIKPGSGPDPNRVIVALIDTPVQSNTPNAGFLLPAISVADGTPAATEVPSHGTSMFETLLRGLEASQGNATESTLRVLPIDVYGAGETTTTFNMASGFFTAVENGATIINVSSGSTSDSEFLHAAVTAAANAGVTIVASAGNDPSTDPVYPAAWNEVVAVTAGDRDGTIAEFANRGDFVDVVGPASTVVDYANERWVVTGTSPAAAYVSGLAGGMAESTGATGAAIKVGLANGLAPAPKQE